MPSGSCSGGFGWEYYSSLEAFETMQGLEVTYTGGFDRAARSNPTRANFTPKMDEIYETSGEFSHWIPESNRWGYPTDDPQWTVELFVNTRGIEYYELHTDDGKRILSPTPTFFQALRVKPTGCRKNVVLTAGSGYKKQGWYKGDMCVVFDRDTAKYKFSSTVEQDCSIRPNGLDPALVVLDLSGQRRVQRRLMAGEARRQPPPELD